MTRRTPVPEAPIGVTREGGRAVRYRACVVVLGTGALRLALARYALQVSPFIAHGP